MYNFTLKMDLLMYYIYRIWLYILRKIFLIINQCYIIKKNTTLDVYCIKNVHTCSFIIVIYFSN